MGITGSCGSFAGVTRISGSWKKTIAGPSALPTADVCLARKTISRLRDDWSTTAATTAGAGAASKPPSESQKDAARILRTPLVLAALEGAALEPGELPT